MTDTETHANTVEIPLSNGRGFTRIDASDAELVATLGPLHADRSENGYAYYSTTIEGKRCSRSLARFLMGAPAGMEVDHINGDRLDNRRSNLRVVTPSENQANRHRPNKNNTSGFTGVYRRHGRWWAGIRVNRKLIHLGFFDTPQEAHEARKRAEAEIR